MHGPELKPHSELPDTPGAGAWVVLSDGETRWRTWTERGIPRESDLERLGWNTESESLLIYGDHAVLDVAPQLIPR